MSGKNFVYTFRAAYKGRGDMAQLQSDLKLMKGIDAYSGLQESFRKANEQFVAAKKKMRDLKRAMADSEADPKLVKSYERAAKLVAALGDKITSLKGRLDNSRESLKSNGIAVSDLAGEYKKLEAAAEEQGRVLAARNMLGVRSFAEINSQIKGLKRAYKDLENSGRLSVKELAVAKDRLRLKVRDLREATNGWGAHLQKIQSGWAGLLGLAGSVAAALRGVRVFTDFDDSMRSVKAVAGATKEEFVELTGFAKEMGATTRFSATDAARGMEELAQSGMKANEIIGALPHAMNMTAIAGGTVKESADLVTDTLAQFSLDIAEAGEVTDVLVKGYTSSSTSLEQLGKALSYAGPVASSFGYSLKDTVAVLEAYAEAGFKGQRGGTAFRGALARLLNPSEKATAVLEKYNIQVTDASGNVRNFADIIADLGKASLTPTEQIQLFGQEAGPGMAALLAQGADKIRDFRAGLEGVGGLAKEIAADKEDGIGGALRRLAASAEAMALAFGNTLAPAVVLVANGLSAVAGIIANLPGPIQSLIGIMAAAVGGFAAWHLGLKHIVAAIRLGVFDLASFGESIVAAAGKVPLLIAKLKALRTSALSASAGLKTIKGWFGVLAAFEIGYMVGEWLLQFDFFKKAGNKVAEMLTLLALKIKQVWAWMTGGDTEAVAREIEEARKIYRDMYEEIGKGAKTVSGTAANTHQQITAAVKKQTKAQVQTVERATAEMMKSYDKLNEKAGTGKKEKVDDFGLTKKEREVMEAELAKLDAAKKASSGRKVRDVEFIKDPKTGEYTARNKNSYTELPTWVRKKEKETGGGKVESVETGKGKEAKADKVVEIRLGNARLRGSEASADALIRQLEQAGMTA